MRIKSKTSLEKCILKKEERQCLVFWEVPGIKGNKGAEGDEAGGAHLMGMHISRWQVR